MPSNLNFIILALISAVLLSFWTMGFIRSVLPGGDARLMARLCNGAAGLSFISAALQSAQFPLQGWLIEVMEAPTPVSALLHAGIVNGGAFLAIRMSPIMSHRCIPYHGRGKSLRPLSGSRLLPYTSGATAGG